MSHLIQAVFENGVLRPLERLDLGEHEQVQVMVGPETPVAESVVVPITTLEPEPFDLARDIPVVVRPTDDGYLATFFDANIGMTGDTREEAVANLRLLLVDVFDELEKEEGQLGPKLVRQLAVLRSFMKRRA
jgi:predicted DNA-binding antitoxin AbrB/MazE fold protein